MSPLLPWVTCLNFLIRVTQSQEVKAKGRSCLVVCLFGGWGLAGEKLSLWDPASSPPYTSSPGFFFFPLSSLERTSTGQQDPKLLLSESGWWWIQGWGREGRKSQPPALRSPTLHHQLHRRYRKPPVILGKKRQKVFFYSCDFKCWEIHIHIYREDWNMKKREKTLDRSLNLSWSQLAHLWNGQTKRNVLT